MSGMSAGCSFSRISKRAKMYFLRLGKTAFIRIKNGQIIQDRCDIGVIGPKLFLVNM